MSQEPDASKRVTSLELLFDLVFVFGFTQVTTVLNDDPTWSGLGRGLLIIAALWWAWASYVWLTSTVLERQSKAIMRMALESVAEPNDLDDIAPRHSRLLAELHTTHADEMGSMR